MKEENAASPQFAFEKRNHPRFLVELPVEYRRANDSSFHPCHTINFSEDGFMVAVSEQMKIDEELGMKIYFSSSSSLNTVAVIVKIACGYRAQGGWLLSVWC